MCPCTALSIFMCNGGAFSPHVGVRNLHPMCQCSRSANGACRIAARWVHNQHTVCCTGNLVHLDELSHNACSQVQVHTVMHVFEGFVHLSMHARACRHVWRCILAETSIIPCISILVFANASAHHRPFFACMQTTHTISERQGREKVYKCRWSMRATHHRIQWLL